MGWIAITKDKEVIRENEAARPVQAGEEGKLAFIMQEDYGHKVAIDLVNGVIIIDYEDWSVDDDIEVSSPKVVLWLCDETSRIAGLVDMEQSEVDENGFRLQTYIPVTWRPIWFTRYIGGTPTKVIGAQTTLPQNYGGKNYKKLVSLFEWGELGID